MKLSKTKKSCNYIYFLFTFIFSYKTLAVGSIRYSISGQSSSDNKSLIKIDSVEDQLPVINIPDIDGLQTVRTLVRIKPHNRDKALTLVDSKLRYLPVDKSDNRQLWWIIQDYEYHAFALANTSNTDRWLYYDDSTENLSVEKNDKKVKDTLLGDYLEKQYFFEFENFNMDKAFYSIRSRYLKTHYLQTKNLNLEYSKWWLGIGKTILRNATHFDIEVFEGYSKENFVYLPMSETDDYTQTKDGKLLNIQANSLITSNKAFLSSSYGFLMNRLGREDMFKITFDSLVTESVVGLLHYKAVIFSNSFYQKKGSRKPIAGLGVKNDNIYIFNKDNVIPTSFKKGTPIVFGYKSGELIVIQSNDTVRIGGVQTPRLLNSSDGNKIKLLMKLPYGGVTIGYNPSVILFGHDFQGEDSTSIIMTNPYLSALEYPEMRTNEFDWTTKTYDLRYKVYGKAVNEEVSSPFYYDKDDFGGIVAKHDFDGRYLGGEDFNYYDGWELIVHDFGYDRFGNETPSLKLRKAPYMILYNRYTSKLRVFVYMSNPTIANNLKISLSDGPRTGVLEKYRPARLWGSYLQGRALDDPNLSTAEYSKMLKLKLATSGSFYFADFTLSYDPCVDEYESNLQLTVSAITQGGLEIVGRTQGGVIPVNSPAISNWLSNSNNYLTGVLNAPYGELSTTLGDINFRNFDRWGSQEWKNTAKFVLPGKKVQDWEKEVARLEYQSENIMSSGELLSGAGKLISGTAKLATAADITNVSTKVGEGIGTLMDGMGQIMKGSGRSLKAKAFRMKYNNLRDEPDQNIKVGLPYPQPSVVFSELVAKGSLSIETVIFDDVIITTPGSKNSELAPNEYAYGSKGAYPLYNEPLGIFNLLYQPKIALSIVKQSKDIGGYIRLKNRPYLAVNGSVDYFGGIFMVNYVITTHDTLGYSTASNRSKPYLLSNKEISGVQFLPSSLDVSDLLDKETLLDDINRYKQNGGNDIGSKINYWVTVELEVEFFGYMGKNGDGTYGASNLSNSYKSNQVSSYEDATGIDKDMDLLLTNFSDLLFGSAYLGDDVELWGENYLINSAYYVKKMDQYCEYKSERVYTKELYPPSTRSTHKLKKEFTKNKINSKPEISSPSSAKTIEKKRIKVYPNPSDGIFTIDYLPKELGVVELLIYDSNGNLMIKHSDYVLSIHSKKEAKINIKNLPSSIYVLMIRFKSGGTYTKKLIKN